MNGERRLPGLDLLRCLAIMMVLGSHFLGLADAIPGWLGEGLRAWERGGWTGVDLFFVLSGFLVTNLLLDEHARTGRVRVGRFLIRRGFKIYPAFYVFTAVATLVFAAEGHFSWPRLGSELLFVQNFCILWWIYPPGGIPIPGQVPVGIIDQAQWSLAVEEHFYFLVGAIFMWLAPRRLPALCLGMAVICLAFRVHYALDHQVRSFGPSLTWTHFRLDSLFFGTLLAYGYHFHGAAFTRIVSRFKIGLGMLGCLGFLPFFLLQRAGHPQLLITYGLTLLYLFSGCLVLAALPLPPWRAFHPLLLIGRYSYGIYLWHLLVRFWVGRWSDQSCPPIAAIALYLTLSIVLGVAMSVLVEEPFLRLRDRLVPRASQTFGLAE